MAEEMPQPEPQRYAVTVFPDQQAADKHEGTRTLAELADGIRSQTRRDKASLPWLKLARFGDQRTGKNCLRSNANVIEISGLEGDMDSGSVTFDDAVARIRAQGVAALVYTTPSNTDAAPHWRVLCPLSSPVPPAQRATLMDRVNGLVGGGLARESWTLSQSYYYGNVEGRPPISVEVVEGACIDQRPDIVGIPRPGNSSEASGTWLRDGNTWSRGETSHTIEGNIVAVSTLGKSWSFEFDTPDKIEEMRRFFESQPAVEADSEGRDYVAMTMARDRGISEDRSVELAVECGADENYARQQAAHAWAYAQNPPGAKTIEARFPIDVIVQYAAPDEDVRALAAQVVERLRQATSRWVFRTPAEDAARPPLTYWDKQGMMPRVIGGCSLIVCGVRSSHKTGVVMKKCLDAVFEKGAKVLYLAPEGAHGIGTARLPAACAQRGKKLEDLTGHWYTLPFAPGLVSEAEIDELITKCREVSFEPDIIVIDTLTRALKGFDINAPQTGAALIAGMERMGAAFNALVAAITHPGKDDSKGSIGSSLIESLAFAIWGVRRVDDAVFVTIEKMKDGPAEFTKAFKVEHQANGVPVITDPAPGEHLVAARKDDAAVSEPAVREILRRRNAYGAGAGVFEDDLAAELAGECPATNADAEEHAAWNTKREKLKVLLRSARNQKKWAQAISDKHCRPGGIQLVGRWYLPALQPGAETSTGLPW